MFAIKMIKTVSIILYLKLGICLDLVLRFEKWLDNKKGLASEPLFVLYFDKKVFRD